MRLRAVPCCAVFFVCCASAESYSRGGFLFHVSFDGAVRSSHFTDPPY